MRTHHPVTAAVLAVIIVFGYTIELSAQGSGRLYGTSTDFNIADLLKIDPATGIGKPLGRLPVGGVLGAAVDPNSGDLYFGAGFLTSLHRIDASGLAYLNSLDALGLTPIGDLNASGLVHMVGPTGLGLVAFGGLDFSHDGKLYASLSIAGPRMSGAEHLATLDKTTGAATVIGTFGTCTVVSPFVSGTCSLEGMEGLAFDGFGNLWGSIRNLNSRGAPGLYLIDPVTGSASFVTSIHDASGGPPGNGVVSLQFACDGTLYGGTVAGAGLAGGRLLTINGATGLFSFVGVLPATTFGRGLGALGFDTPCIRVAIDIKPGGTPSAINRKSKGNTPVAVLGSATFNVSVLDVSSVRFAGAAALLIGGGLEDVNGDGFVDQVLHFSTDELNLPDGITKACMTGRTVAGDAFTSCDSVDLVK